MIVNGFWFGELGEVQQKCIDSWENNGYEFKLWDESNCDWIVSTDEYFTYKHGHSKGTPVAFSNLFRAELLFQQGGLYVDLDMLCLKPYEFNKRFVFSEQVDSGWDYHVATSIIYSKNSGEQIFKDWASRIRKIGENSSHGDLGPNLLTPLVEQYGHKDYVLPKEYFCPIDWQSYEDIFTYDGDAYGLHLYNSIWSKEDYERFQ
tara:strand:+ start:147 stop:758 length:612 start_codon:yes stop_codon:yes gene_type:complete